MDTDAIENELVEYIRASLATEPDAEITPETDLIGEGVLDSVAMVDLVVWVEENYAFRVDVEDLEPESFGSVLLIAKYVAERAGGSG